MTVGGDADSAVQSHTTGSRFSSLRVVNPLTLP